MRKSILLLLVLLFSVQADDVDPVPKSEQQVMNDPEYGDVG
ncbi:hypothetical protein [Aquibacillus albus]|uniref:Phosphatase n=1 Tax=Aquibacillus albus TaxID=1168171 RepID=A0ABS2MZI8_9BACI|nr:hypothetical protein [Aquibacillus albus]MBM7571301.1 hypothetical protein [Aquibacillus albus]